MIPDDIQCLDGMYMFYFGVRECDLPRVPLNTLFEVVYSPSHMGTIAQDWRLIQYIVVYSLSRITRQFERVCREVERRPLNEAEIAFMETFVIG